MSPCFHFLRTLQCGISHLQHDALSYQHARMPTCKPVYTPLALVTGSGLRPETR